MKFSYKVYGQCSRPVIPIVLRHSGKWIKYEALVDSGADICLFHSEVGDYLGLDNKNSRPHEVFGVGGKVSVYYLHEIVVEVGGVPHKIEAGFMPGVSGSLMDYGVLGQNGFFNLFKSVNFDFNKKDLELKMLK